MLSRRGYGPGFLVEHDLRTVRFIPRKDSRQSPYRRSRLHPVGHTDMHIATRTSGGDAYGTTLMQRSE